MLTVTKIKTLEPGKHHDEQGLYLELRTAKRGKWTLRYRLNGRSREMGLGPYPEISLSEARDRRRELRQLIAKGSDPLEERRRAEALKAEKDQLRFSHLAEKYIAENSPGWRNEKHALQWSHTLATYAYPILDQKPLSEITVDDVLDVLRPIWNSKNETARRVQQRMSRVFGSAISRGLYEGSNPAAWADNLKYNLPPPESVQRVKHHLAMPWDQLPTFYNQISEPESVSSMALQFLILTAGRTIEVVGCNRDELDFRKGLWHIPEERMKARKAHDVPLSEPALAILEKRLISHNYFYVFSGLGSDRPLSNAAMRKLMRDRFPKRKETVHGFRSTFRDWAAETGNYNQNVVEFALAHQLPSRSEAAYMRSDLIDKRRILMNDWGKYVTSECGQSVH